MASWRSRDPVAMLDDREISSFRTAVGSNNAHGQVQRLCDIQDIYCFVFSILVREMIETRRPEGYGSTMLFKHSYPIHDGVYHTRVVNLWGPKIYQPGLLFENVVVYNVTPGDVQQCCLGQLGISLTVLAAGPQYGV